MVFMLLNYFFVLFESTWIYFLTWKSDKDLDLKAYKRSFLFQLLVFQTFKAKKINEPFSADYKLVAARASYRTFFFKITSNRYNLHLLYIFCAASTVIEGKSFLLLFFLF